LKNRTAALIIAVICAAVTACDRSEYHLNEGNRAFHLGKWSEARAHYQRAADSPHTRTAAAYNLSRVATAEGDTASALQYLEQVLTAEPTDRNARLDRSDLWLELGDTVAAETDLLVAAKEGNGEVWLRLAKLKAAQGLSEEAEKLLSQAASDEQTRGEALLFRGTLARQRRDWSSAIRNLEAAAQILPYSAEVAFELARSLLGTDDPREAIRQFRRGLTLEPQNQQAQAELAKALAIIGEALPPGDSRR
jgi:tetratricopeptide (TPR) repeat protein